MEDPDSEQALRELKVRLTNAAPAKSLIAQVQHREQRQERRRVAAARGEPSLPPAPLAHDIAVAAATAPPVVDADNDARELEPWFRELPAAERERLRAHWWSERHRNDDAGLRARRRLARAIGCGALLFFVLSLPQALLGGLAVVPALVAAGAMAGGAAHLCGGGRFVYSCAGALAFCTVMGMSVLSPMGLSCVMLATYGMGIVGMDGEMRRSGGFEAK